MMEYYDKNMKANLQFKLYKVLYQIVQKQKLEVMKTSLAMAISIRYAAEIDDYSISISFIIER